jgi:hypothetical protein
LRPINALSLPAWADALARQYWQLRHAFRHPLEKHAAETAEMGPRIRKTGNKCVSQIGEKQPRARAGKCLAGRRKEELKDR